MRFRRYLGLTLWAALCSGCGGCVNCGSSAAPQSDASCAGAGVASFGCPDASVPHGHYAEFFGCYVDCDPGYALCTPSSQSCVLASECPPAPDAEAKDADAASPPDGAALFALASDPRGLTVCGDTLFAADDGAVYAISLADAGASTLALLPGAARGLSCADGYVYVTTSSDAGGSVIAIAPDGGASALATGVDPGVGVEADDGGVYWLARSWDGGAGGVAHTSAIDGASALLLAGVETGVYKAFSSGPPLLSIAQGDIHALASDGGDEPWTIDGGVALAVSSSAGEAHALITFSDGGLASVVSLADGGFAPLGAASVLTPAAMVETSDAVLVAAYGGIVAIDKATAKFTWIAKVASPIVDLAAAPCWVYWTTASPAVVWAAPR